MIGTILRPLSYIGETTKGFAYNKERIIKQLKDI